MPSVALRDLRALANVKPLPTEAALDQHAVFAVQAEL